MRVLQVVPGTSPNFGGPSVALTDMTRLLRARGVEATLLTTNIDPAVGRLDVPLGVMTTQRGAPIIYCNVWPRTRYAFSLPLFWRLLRTVDRYDVVHIHWLYNFAPLAAAAAARWRNVPYVVQPNGSLDPNLMRRNHRMKRLYNSSAGGFILHNAAGLIYTTESEQRLAEIWGCKTPSYVVPVGLDSEEYANLPPRGAFRRRFPHLENQSMVLFLSRISRQKGLDLLIPAFRAVAERHPRAHLVIAGSDGEGYSVRVKQWIADAGLGERVTVAGRLSDEMKLAAYADADVFVLPSYAENFGAVVTEALAVGCPVVISDRVNLCDEVASAKAGIVTQCTSESVAAGLDRVLANPALAKTMGENGRKLVQSKFTWQQVLDQIIPIYQSLIRDKIARRPQLRRDFGE